MKIMAIQNKVFMKKEDTLNHILEMIKGLENERIDLIALPEMFSCIYELEAFKSGFDTSNSQIFTFLSTLARSFDSFVVGGSIPFKDEESIYNSTFVFNPEGEKVTRYDKIHLFEIEYPNGDVFREKDVLSGGEKVVYFDTDFGRIGLMICFDIRFPELAAKLTDLSCDILVVPAAFNTYTGPMHWTTTFKARAIDNQLFTLGVSPSADSEGSYNVYGHSILVNPYGEVLFELDDSSDYFIYEIDLKEVEKVRRNIPILKNRVFGKGDNNV